MTQPNINTGNPIVDAISKLNITPEIWYKTISNEKGKPNLLAIKILSDILIFIGIIGLLISFGSLIIAFLAFLDRDRNNKRKK